MSWPVDPAATLQIEHVLLRPVAEQDREPLKAIALDDSIWRYFVIRISTGADFDAFFDTGLADHEAGRRAVYTIIDTRTDSVAGSMSFGNLFPKDQRVEIGWSWLGKDFQGAGINRWSKFLLMRHAFEAMRAERVEFKTDVLNLQARKALSNVGATEEGVLRSFNPMPDGRRRDAIYYSVLRAEWPQVKQQLTDQAKITR